MYGIPPPITSSRWGARTKRTVVLLSLAVIAYIIFNLLELFPLLIIATLLSYLLWPIVNFIERRILGILPFKARALAVVLAFSMVIGLFTLLGIIIVPAFIEQIEEAGSNLPQFITDVELEVERILSQRVRLPFVNDGRPFVPMERLQDITGKDHIADMLQLQLDNFDLMGTAGQAFGGLDGLTGPAFSVLGTFFNGVVNLTFLLVIMFFLIRDGEFFTHQLISITPVSYQGDVRRLLYELGKVWNAYLRGQVILCLIIGFAVYFASLILGVPNAPILGLVAGTLEFIPNLGPFLALVPAAFMALFSQSSTLPFLEGLPFALLVCIVWTGIQNLEALFLVPRVMGSNLNLHPVVVIIAVLAGASIAGVLGVVLAAPFIATARLVGQYIYCKLFDLDPFPTPKWGESQPRLAPVRLATSVRQHFPLLVTTLRERFTVRFNAETHPPDSVIPEVPQQSNVSAQPDKETQI